VNEVRVRFGNQFSRNKLCHARLTRRRKIVGQTLQYVDREQKAVDSNRAWKNQAAQQRRKNLLNKIHGWYEREAKKIDSVVARLTEPAPPVAKRAKAKHERLTP
jgi:hypothetical protein